MNSIVTSNDHFLSCDWGTTSFRLRLVSRPDGAVLAEVKERAGVKTINESLDPSLGAGEIGAARAAGFADYLRGKLRQLPMGTMSEGRGLPIVISGMASSTVGWQEVPYATTPFPLDGSNVRFERLSLDVDGCEYPVFLLAGVRTETDIMRGEETEILGLFASNESEAVFDLGVVLLPGTHTKHVWVRERVIEGFQTHMTGEVYDILIRHSLLKASIASDLEGVGLSEADPQCKNAFLAGVEQAQARGLLHNLFQVRTRTVLHNVAPAVNHWFLSGVLVGAEILDLMTHAPNAPVLIAAPPTMASLYQIALEALSPNAEIVCAGSETVKRAAVLGQAFILNRLMHHSSQ